MQVSVDDVEAGLECYDPEQRLFPKLRYGAGIQELTARHVLLILRWKLGRIKDSHANTVRYSNLKIINGALTLAGQNGRELEAIDALMNVDGVGLAVASVILTVRYPEKFTIIDWRALEALGLLPATTDKWTAREYLERFLVAVQDFAIQNGLCLRQADRALWGLSLNKRLLSTMDAARSVLPPPPV